jgi:phage baseplate assembly protein W
MGTLSFKSVGRTAQSLQDEAVEEKVLPVGIKTPLQLEVVDGPLAMHYSLEDQLSDNLRNLLQTNFGERLGIYDFGANLKPLTVNFSSQDVFDAEALNRIATAISRWMPYVEPIDYISEVDRSQRLNTALIRITITYNIPSLNISGKKIQTVLYVI